MKRHLTSTQITGNGRGLVKVTYAHHTVMNTLPKYLKVPYCIFGNNNDEVSSLWRSVLKSVDNEVWGARARG